MSEDVEKNITKSVCELQMDGTIWWTLTNRHNEELNERISSQGNMFNSIEEAEKERDRRNLLARLNRFRNEKNDGWIPNWNRWQELKFCIYWSNETLIARPCDTLLGFNMFGYFKNRDDCLEAIGKFGHEIKRLYVEN